MEMTKASQSLRQLRCFSYQAQPKQKPNQQPKHKEQTTHRYFSLLHSDTEAVDCSRQQESKNPIITTATTTTTTTTTGHAAAPSPSGHEFYKQYLETKQKAEQLRQELERKKSEQLFRAWQRAEEKQQQRASSSTTSTSKAGGVAVVQTLAKQLSKTDRTEEKIRDLERQAQLSLEQAAFTGNEPLPEALVVLGNQCLANEQVKRALELWKQSNSAEGWFNVGHLLWTGYSGGGSNNNNNDSSNTNEPPQALSEIPADPAAAMEAFDKAVALGDVDATYFVGVQKLSVEEEDHAYCDHSKDRTAVPLVLLSQQLREGLDYVERAANAGHGGAMYYLALLHLNGHERLGIPPCPPAEFVERLDRAASSGDADSLFLRGHCFYHGESGYPRSVARALDDFLLAAQAGNANAAVSAGAILHKGYPAEGIPRDQRRAFELYQHAGELGSLEGWRNVVACYATGEGVPQSLETARYISQTMLKDDHVTTTTRKQD